MNMQASREDAIAFAEFMYTQHGNLHPWSKEKASDYHVDRADFGMPGMCMSTQYYRMTPEEYGKYKEKLPGDTAWNWDSGMDNWFTGDVGSFVGGTLFGLVNDEAADKKAWWEYRQASGTWSDAGEVTPPGISSGEAPWAKVLHEDWKEAVNRRCTEVDDVRGEIEYLMPTLIKAADDYMGTDLSNATGLDLSAEGLDKSHKER